MRWLIYAALLYLIFRSLSGRRRRSKIAPAVIGGAAPRPTLEPHEILEVAADASAADIRAAYQQKISQYHPDRVANAAPELQRLAEQRSKEINLAYEAMTARAARSS